MMVHGGASVERGMIEGDCCWHSVLMSVCASGGGIWVNG